MLMLEAPDSYATSPNKEGTKITTTNIERAFSAVSSFLLNSITTNITSIPLKTVK